MRYVLVTPARNEERFIAKTLESMVAQTMPPERWVIVDDGSTDKTSEIVQRYAGAYPWIQLVRLPQHAVVGARRVVDGQRRRGSPLNVSLGGTVF